MENQAFTQYDAVENWASLQPGDMVFRSVKAEEYGEAAELAAKLFYHTAVFVGNGEVVEINVNSNNRVVRRTLDEARFAPGLTWRCSPGQGIVWLPPDERVHRAINAVGREMTYQFAGLCDLNDQRELIARDAETFPSCGNCQTLAFWIVAARAESPQSGLIKRLLAKFCC